MRRLFILALTLAACSSEKGEPPAFERVEVADLPGFAQAQMLPALNAFVTSCTWLTGTGDIALGTAEDWRPLCAEAETLRSEAEAKAFFSSRFDAVRLAGGEGLMTGYFEPVYAARTEPQAPYTAPVLAAPDDLIAVNLGAFRDDLKGRRIAGRIEGGQLVPYADREAIENGAPIEADVLGYMDPDDLFFLQIQGSGVLEYPEGERRIGYAAQNGHPYKAIGRTLVEEGHMPLEEVTMQSIRDWLTDAAEGDAARVRATNPSYVFFTDRGPADGDEGPIGTAGVGLTPMHSVAVDRTQIPLGAPVFITGSDDVLSYSELAVAQDTGGAIRGPVRIDLFLGRGDQAGDVAGRLKLSINAAVLIPKGAALPEPAASS